MVTSGSAVRSTRPARSLSRTVAGSFFASLVAATENSNGRSCLRSAISISIPGSANAPSTSTTRAIGSRDAEGCSTISTTTTSPDLAPPRSAGPISKSCSMRLFSATANQSPRSSCSLPTTVRLARSSTSTISPSGRPRRSTPVRRTEHAVAVQRLVHLALGQHDVGRAVVGLEEAEAVRVTLQDAGDEVELGRDEQLALAVDDDLAVALHRREAAGERFARAGVDGERLLDLGGGLRHAGVAQRRQDRGAGGHELGVEVAARVAGGSFRGRNGIAAAMLGGRGGGWKGRGGAGLF